MTLSRIAALFGISAALSLAFTAPAPAQTRASSGSPQSNTLRGETQTINVYSFGFQPHPIHLAAGRQVTLTFVNRSGSSHDFTARTFFHASRILSGNVAEGEVELAPHETKTITLVPRTGTYKAHCSHFLHATMGMTDNIVVD